MNRIALMARTIIRVSMLLILLAFVASAQSITTSADEADSPSSATAPLTFRDISAANQANPGRPLLWDNALSWGRQDLTWGHLEPEPGRWNEEALAKFGRRVIAYREVGARLLPILSYNTPWSWDRSDRSFEYGNDRWDIQPNGDHTYTVTHFERIPGGGWKVLSKRSKKGTDKWPLALEHVGDWEAYTRRVVRYLRQPPYNVEYFQIWNEAHPKSGFWFGDFETYMERVHLPAARIIHEEGGKVVYGGWPCCGSIEEYINVLDQYDAWKSIDVLAVHYFRAAAYEILEHEAWQRGHTEMEVWQTEVGFTASPAYVASFYPPLMHWILRHPPDQRQRYKAFYFAFWSPDDPAAYGYQHTLYSGDHLSTHGLSLKTLGDLFGLATPSIYDGVISDPELTPALTDRQSHMEAFRTDRRIIIAIHQAVELGQQPDEAAITLRLPGINNNDVDSLQRITATGEAKDISPFMRRTASMNLFFSVPAREDNDAIGPAYATDALDTWTFYVVVNLKDNSAATGH